MKKVKLGLIGCGWLGKALAIKLIHRQDYDILATSSSDRSAEFKADNIPYITYALSYDSIVPQDLLDCDVIIYTITPLELVVVKNFFNKFPSDKKIIFISSTSVYGTNRGDSDENTLLDKNNTNSSLLFEAEEYLRSKFTQVTILRLAGLYGVQRNPIYFLQGRTNLPGATQWLHLVHQDDCLEAIQVILENNIWNETINIISDLRILKKDYYTMMAIKLSLPLPMYKTDEDNSQNPTKLSNEKSKRLLNITYKNPADYLPGSL